MESIGELKQRLQAAENQIEELRAENEELKCSISGGRNEKSSGSGEHRDRAVAADYGKTSTGGSGGHRDRTAGEGIGENTTVGRGHRARIFGDSMVRYSGQVCQEAGVEVSCYPGIKIEQMGNMISRQCDDEHKESILIHVGTNDIKRQGSVDYIMGEVYDLARNAKEKFRNADIIISGVIRRRDVSFKMVYGLNNGIDWVCEMLNCTFVDPNAWIDDSDIGRDGIHLNRRGARKLGELHRRVLTASRGRRQVSTGRR